MNILLTSATSDRAWAEVRVPNGHRLKAFNLSFNQEQEYFDWCCTLYDDSSLDIGVHYESFPLKHVQTVVKNKRLETVQKWGDQLRFFHLHNHQDQVLAYSLSALPQEPHGRQILKYEIPFLSLFVREWFGPTSLSRSEHTAMLYVGSQHSALSLFSNGILVNQAVIAFRTPADLLYHYLFSLDEFDIEPKSCAVHMLGPESGKESIVNLFTEQTLLDQDFFRNPDDPVQFDLKLLWKCAS